MSEDKNFKQSVLGSNPIEIDFDQGTLVLKGADSGVPHVKWDGRVDEYRSEAYHYRDILEWAEDLGIQVNDKASNYEELNLDSSLEIEFRDYQKNALEAWDDNNSSGSVILPTGSGKTFLGIQAIEEVSVSSLIIVPTIDLLSQWYSILSSAFGEQVPIGVLGGGEQEVRHLTVSTYDSAYLYMDKYGDRFGLLIFDEVHHCGAPSYQQIPEMSIAPYRLGLTATYERTDDKHLELESLIGPKVYEEHPEDLAGEYLSEYETIRMKVQLTEEERKRYDEEYQKYKEYIKENDIKIWGNDGYQRFLRRTASDPEARRALIAKNRSEKIARTAKNKLDLVDDLIKRHHNDRVLIFTANNDFAYRISKEFVIPCISHQTKTSERTEILEKFKKGEYSILVTSRVLDEGVNVPAANIGIIISGSASKRQYVQRLGRILRKTEEREEAILYEIITDNTKEKHISQRRRAKE